MLATTHKMTTTQQVFNPPFTNPDDMPEYVSIYDKPKRGRGRPRGSKYSDEEKITRHREANSRCYYNNHEYDLLQKRSYKQATCEAKKC